MSINQQTINPKVSPLCTIIALALVVAFGCFAQARAQWTTPDANQNINNTNTGNVGIGATTPTSKLEVNGRIRQTGSSTDAGYLQTNSGLLASTTALNPGIAFYGGNGANALYGADLGYNSTVSRYRTRIFSGNVLADVALGRQQTAESNPTQSAFLEFLTIRGDTGNVGIGTAAPDVKLQVHHSSTNTNLANVGLADLVLGLRNTSNTNGNLSVISFQDSAGYGNVNITAIQKDQTNHSADLLFFTRTNTTTFGERMRITSTGEVGIGTTTPTQKLEVNGSALINTIYGSSASSGVLSLQSTSHATKGTIQIGFDQTSTTKIGQSGTPGDKLLVASDRLIVNNAGVRVNGAADYADLSVTKVNITNPDALQFRSSNPNIQSNGSLLFTVQNVGGDNVKFNVQNNSISNAFVIDTNSATPAKLLDIRNLGTSKFTVSGNGDVTIAGNIAAKYQDVAEWVESSQELPPGTVVVLDPTKSNQVIASTQAYDSSVAGVISLRPGLTLGEGGEGHVLVATTGRVKVKVDATNGPIRIGDLLVTSDKAGFAKKSEPVDVGGVRIHRPGTLIGKALEPLDQGTGEILVLLSLQ